MPAGADADAASDEPDEAPDLPASGFSDFFSDFDAPSDDAPAFDSPDSAGSFLPGLA